MKKVRFYTLGCKTNQYETQAIRESLLSTGRFTEAGPNEKNDICIINTCTVTAKADKESCSAVRRSHRKNPGSKIIVTGCLVEKDTGLISGLPDVSLVVKNNQKHLIRNLLEDHTPKNTSPGSPDFTPLKISNFAGHTKAFIKVQDGCDNHCSYCKVPLVRGNSRSRGPEDIIEEVRRLILTGFKEIVLTGICLGAWGRDLDKDLRLHDLLKSIDSIDEDFRIRLSSIEPDMITQELIETMKRSKRVCRHLHVPLQSGSNKILRIMNRPYTARQYMRLIKTIKRAMPGISITSDVITGFPGETYRNFRQTYSLVRSAVFSRLHIFPYSRRSGTPAAELRDSVPISEVKKRKRLLETLAKATSLRYRKRFINKCVKGLVETKRDSKTGLLTGYTDTYIKFLADGPDELMRRIIPLKVCNADLNTTFCKHLC